MGTTLEKDRFSQNYINLAHVRLGAKAIYATDEFFAPCERMLETTPAVFIPDKFDDTGKWMDGWETRRKRVQGYDYCIVRLGRAGMIKGVDIDTSHFRGNHPPAASIDACFCPDQDPDDNTQWVEILSCVALQQDSHHLHDINNNGIYTHIRLNIYPDGGVARLRIYGHPHCQWDKHDDKQAIDLLAMEYGGRAITCSNEAFGSSMLSLNMPQRAISMGDGWETARRRVPGNEWAILALGHPGIVETIELDTKHYKGNYPDRASIQAGLVKPGPDSVLTTQSMFWPYLLAEQSLVMDAINQFDATDLGPVSHVRVNIIPDGGLGRVRLHGRIARVQL